MEKLYLVTPSDQVLAAYRDCALAQGLGRPPVYPHRGIFIVDGRGIFVAGVGIFDTVDGPFTLVEDAVTNPSVPMRTRHAAAMIAFEAVLAYAMTHRRAIFAMVRSSGIKAMCRRMGFHADPCELLVYNHSYVPVEIARYDRKKPAEVAEASAGPEQPHEPRGGLSPSDRGEANASASASLAPPEVPVKRAPLPRARRVSW